ncbi:MAG: DUF3857 domain-containing transglutaminase family protein, partial [Candidatus Binatia bacterium]
MYSTKGIIAVSARVVIALLGSGTPAWAAEPAAEKEQAVRIESLVVRDRVEEDGILVRRQRNTVVVLTPGGVAQFSQVGVPFFESNQKAKLERLVVTKPDGRELDLRDSAPIDVAPVFPANLPIYSDLRVLRAAVPSLGVGDRVSFETSVCVEPLVERHVWQEMGFAEPDVAASQHYELDVPDGSRIGVHVRPGFEPVFEEERRDGRWIRRWRLDAPAKGDAVETAGRPEGDAKEDADEEEPGAQIQVTSFTSWDELGKWWSSLAPLNVDATVKAKAAELTAPHGTPIEKLRAIHRYVAQEIRYLALPLGLGRYRAREPEEVVRTGLGDCKDKVRLLASLAASVGIEVDNVLVSAGEKRKLIEAAPS